MMEKGERHLPQVSVCRCSRPGKLQGTRALHAVTQPKRCWNNRDAGDGWRGWSAAVHGCKLSRRDGEEEEGACLVCGGAAQIYGTIKSLRESMWVRGRGGAVPVTRWWQRVADPLTQREGVGEAFLKAHALILLGNFNVPETCLQDGRSSGGRQGQLRAAGTGGTSRGDARLGLLFSSREELFWGRGNQRQLCLWGP